MEVKRFIILSSSRLEDARVLPSCSIGSWEVTPHLCLCLSVCMSVYLSVCMSPLHRHLCNSPLILTQLFHLPLVFSLFLSHFRRLFLANMILRCQADVLNKFQSTNLLNLYLLQTPTPPPTPSLPDFKPPNFLPSD